MPEQSSRIFLEIQKYTEFNKVKFRMYGNPIKNYQTCRKAGEIYLILKKKE